jgi:hypothetical protein
VLITHGGEVVELSTGALCPARMWKALRGCGRALGSPCLVTVRDADISYFDLATGEHVFFWGLRSGCTNSIIPADGILSIPNYAHHCTCNYALSASLALATMPEAASWDPSRPSPAAALQR